MLWKPKLDGLYTAFCDGLAPELSACARELPYRLRLADAPGKPFSEVFGHEVTFAAPALVAEAIPSLPEAKVSDAVLAHALAVIDGFGTDRIEDRQIASSPEIDRVLALMREASSRALGRVVGDDALATSALYRARASMLQAIRAEQRLMTDRAAADFACYERTARGKTAIGTPASVALARAAGWGEDRCRVVSETLSGVWLGMQYHDDALDWDGDLRRESAWAVLLARGAGAAIEDGSGRWNPSDVEPDDTRRAVLGSGVLARMLARSSRHFQSARRGADALGARALASWAAAKGKHADFLAREEERNAGYAARLYALSPWGAPSAS